METGTCCRPAPPHICNRTPPGSHNCPWDTKSFDLKNHKRCFARRAQNICSLDLDAGEGEGGGGGRAAGSHCFVSLVFLLFCSQEWHESSNGEFMTNTESSVHDDSISLLSQTADSKFCYLDVMCFINCNTINNSIQFNSIHYVF